MDHDGPFAITNFLKTVKPTAPDSPNIKPDFILGNKTTTTQPQPPNILESLFSSQQHQSDRKRNVLGAKSGIPTLQSHSINRTIDPSLNPSSIIKTQTLQQNLNTSMEDTMTGFHPKSSSANIQTSSTERAIQTALESVLLPAVSSACVQYMNQLSEIFKTRVDRIMKQQAISSFGDEPLVQLLLALQKQDSDQVIDVLNGLDRVGNLFLCLSIPRLFDLLSLLAGFLSEYFQVEPTDVSYLPFKESDAISMALPWILESLISLRHLIQKQPSLFSYPITPSQHPHSCYILSCLKNQLYIIQSNFSEFLDSEHGIKLNSIFHILDTIWTDTE